jgi:hypothetical protein
MPPYLPCHPRALLKITCVRLLPETALPKHHSIQCPPTTPLSVSTARQLSTTYSCRSEETFDTNPSTAEAIKSGKRSGGFDTKAIKLSARPSQRSQEPKFERRPNSHNRPHISKSKLRGTPRSSASQKTLSARDNGNGSDAGPLGVDKPRAQRENWQTQKEALGKKLGEQGWQPRKRLSPDTIQGIRALHEQFPARYTTPVLAEHFKISPEAIRRILKSKWTPTVGKMEERRARWAKRHDRIWDAQVEMGLRPPRKKERKPDKIEDIDEIVPFDPPTG